MTTLLAAVIGFVIALGAYFYYGHVAEAPATVPTETEQNEGARPSTGTPALNAVHRSGQNLTSISKDEILAMGNIQQLDLSNNKLTGALPAEIRRLSNLEVLNISNNKMTGLPAEIGQLSKLRVLNAANNQLTGIPHELGNLQNLEVLDLSGNDISEQDLQVIRAKLPASAQIIL